MVYLALYKGKGVIGNAAIRAWTRSEYSHCELVVNGTAYSSSLMDGGVRAKDIYLREDNWDLVELPDSVGKRIQDYFEKTKGTKYGWFDLITNQVFNRSVDSGGSSFCSEWVAAALGLPSPVIYSPKTVGELVKYLVSNNFNFN